MLIFINKCLIGRMKAEILEEAEGSDATCMLKTSSELSDWPVMLLTSLEAWEDSEDEE